MNELLRLKDVMDSQPKAPPAEPPVLDGPPPGKVHCACGKKYIPLEEVKFHNTPHCKGASDNICDECHRQVPGHAVVVCVRCQAVVSRIPPHKDKTGFVFAPNAYYHVPYCPTCSPGCQSSPLAEKAIFDRQRFGK